MSHESNKKEIEKIDTLLAVKQEANANFLKECWMLEKDEHVISQKRTLLICGRKQWHRTLPTQQIHRKKEMKKSNYRENAKRKLTSSKRSNNCITVRSNAFRKNSLAEHFVNPVWMMFLLWNRYLKNAENST